jgi:hypothetical protein
MAKNALNGLDYFSMKKVLFFDDFAASNVGQKSFSLSGFHCAEPPSGAEPFFSFVKSVKKVRISKV